MGKRYYLAREKFKKAASQQCDGKQRYNLKEAKTQAKAVARSGRVKVARIYECHICQGWHIARSQPWEKRFKD